jgi:uncharacterized protein YndB with AHSA1/START domain
MRMSDRPTVEVEMFIEAPPARVWELMTDIVLMGQWSPEYQGGEWLDGATGPTVGARFKGRNKRQDREWESVSTVIEAEPGRAVAWAVGDANPRPPPRTPIVWPPAPLVPGEPSMLWTCRRGAMPPSATTLMPSWPSASPAWPSLWEVWARLLPTSTTMPIVARAGPMPPLKSNGCGSLGNTKKLPNSSPTTWCSRRP